MPTTPYLVVDEDVLHRNISRMAARGEELGVRVRPHVKTHKIPEIARAQRAAGAEGITVATVSEAEVFVDAGFDDLFIAYPLWLDPERGERLAALTHRARVRIGCDSVPAAQQAARALRGAPVQVLVEVDSGQGRSGVAPDEAGDVARAAVDAGLSVVGVFTFPGHSYTPETEARRAAAEQELTSLADGARALRSVGVEPHVRSGGSSPSMPFSHRLDASDVSPTEMRPGAYVFNDAQQWEVGACAPADIALTAYATVVSHRPAERRVVLDAGSKALGADRPAWASGSGRVLDHPEARIVQLSEHHAVVEIPEGPLPELGSIVRAVPNHCCNAINLADFVEVRRGGTPVTTWLVAARGANG